MVKFGKHSVSRLLCGGNTFYGVSHLSAMLDYEFRTYSTPEQVAKMLRRCEAEGITACQGIPWEPWKLYTGEAGKLQIFATGNDPKMIAAQAKGAGCIGLHHYGVSTDALYKTGKLDTAREYLKRVRDTGALVGLASHIPAAIDTAESQGWDVDYYMTSVYQWGRSKEELEQLFAGRKELLPVETYSMQRANKYSEVFLNGDPERMYKVIRQVKKPCLVYKILASGRKADTPVAVEQAFKEAFENIKPTDAIIVGMYNRYIDQVAQNAEYTRRFGAVATSSVTA